MRKLIAALLGTIVVLLALTACGETKIVHCDHCGAEILLDADDKITEDWILFCEACEEELFGDNPVVDPG